MEPESDKNVKTPIKRVRLDHEHIKINSPVHTQQPDEHNMRRNIDAVSEDLWSVSQDGFHLNLTTEDKLRHKGSFDSGWLNDYHRCQSTCLAAAISK